MVSIATDLVQRDDKGGLLVPKQLDRLNSLWFQPVHDINDQDRNVTQRTTSTP